MEAPTPQFPSETQRAPLLGLPGRPGWRGELPILGFYLLATILLTWPIAITLNQASGARGDYFNNIWNVWWVQKALHGPEVLSWTDYLYFPDGISLRRHTLSLVNAFPGAFLWDVLDRDAVFNLTVLVHFFLSGWCFSIFARYVTGSTAGSVLAGVVYSFSPFHYFYLCQVNVSALEFAPLALLFFCRSYSEGGLRNTLGVVLSMAAIAGSSSYYVVYVGLSAGFLLLGGRLWDPRTPVLVGARRMIFAGVLGILAVVAVSWQLLYATLGPEAGQEIGTAAFGVQKHRVNDLFGFRWLGGGEQAVVSWPSMLGYSTLALCLFGFRRVWQLKIWLLIGTFFFVLSLGEALEVNGQETGIPLPYVLLRDLPVLSMLRKSDRCFMMVLLVACLALAAAWPALAQRLRDGWPRRVLWTGMVVLCAVELTGVPFGRYDLEPSPWFDELAADPEIEAILELPVMNTHVANGRFDYFQTYHEKKGTLGYTTALAATELHDTRLETLLNYYVLFLQMQGEDGLLKRVVPFTGVDMVVHYRTFQMDRPLIEEINEQVLWEPFFFKRRPLVFIRQTGQYHDVRIEDAQWAAIRRVLVYYYGEPAHEDESMMAFRVRK